MNLEFKIPNIRLANIKDAPQILEIYSDYIINSSVSFEYEVPHISEFSARMERVLKDYPWLVAVENEKVTGYAYANKFRERKAYDWCCEVSVYLHIDYMKKGIAKNLYDELIRILEDLGYNNFIAGITLPNEKSVHFHEKFGFEKIGSFRKVGYKLNEWWDVGFWQLIKLNNQNGEKIKSFEQR